MRWVVVPVTSVLLATFVVLIHPAPTVHAAGASLSMVPATIALKPGASTDVFVVLTSDVPTRGIQLGLKYDPRIINIDHISDGTFYQGWASSQGLKASTMIPFKADNSKGSVTVGTTVILGGKPGQGATGSAPILIVSLTALAGATGQTTLDFVNVIVSDSATVPSGIPGVTASGCAIGVGEGLDSSALQAPGAAGVTSIQAPAEPGFGITDRGLGNVSGPTVTQPQPQPALQQVVAQPSTSTPVPPTVALPTALPTSVTTAPTPMPAPELIAQSAVVQSAPPGSVANVNAGPQQQFTPGGSTPAQSPPVAAAQATLRPLATPTRQPVAAAPVTVSRSSSGVLIPWEVLAGIGGGIVSAGLALYALRGRDREASS